MLEEAEKRIAIVHCVGVGIDIGWRRLWNRMVWRVDGIGAVDADTAFVPFLDGPLKWIEKKSHYEKDKEFGQDNNMEGFLLFCSEFGFNVVTVVVDFRVIIVDDSGLEFLRWLTN